MNYKIEKWKFQRKQRKSHLRLLKLTRLLWWGMSVLNKIDGLIIKSLLVLLGFQYDIYIKLQEVSFDNSYLERAELVEAQIQMTLIGLGE